MSTSCLSLSPPFDAPSLRLSSEACDSRSLTAAGLSTDNSKPNSTALSDSDVSLKLNKRDGHPIFSFEIRGRVRPRLVPALSSPRCPALTADDERQGAEHHA